MNYFSGSSFVGLAIHSLHSPRDISGVDKTFDELSVEGLKWQLIGYESEFVHLLRPR